MIIFVSNCEECKEEFNIEPYNDSNLCPNCIISKQSVHIVNILTQLDNDKNICCIAPAGSSKSYTLKQLQQVLYARKTLKQKSYNFVTVTPTGNSAINVNGNTYHSIFGWRTRNDKDLGFFCGISCYDLIRLPFDQLRSKLVKSKKYISIISKFVSIDLIIWDEFGAINDKHWKSMDMLCRAIRNVNQPFGGIRIVIFGDPLQLRPADMSKPCYLTDTWDQLNFVMIELAPNGKLARFSDETFSDMTRFIRLGLMSQHIINIIGTRQNLTNESSTQIFFTNKDVHEANSAYYNSLNTTEYSYPSSLLELKFTLMKGTIRKPVTIEELMPWKSAIHVINIFRSTTTNSLEKMYGEWECIKIKEGLRVFCTTNRKQDGQFIHTNGSCGKVEKCLDKQVIIRDDYNKEIEVEYTTLTFNVHINLESDIWLDIGAHVSLMPLRLAKAISLYRCQGLTFGAVEILGKNLNKYPGAHYVAISRCSNVEQLFLKEFDITKLRSYQPAIVKFSAHVENELKYLYNVHSEWFDSPTVQLDNSCQNDCLLQLITKIKELSVRDTSYETKTVVRGHAQQQLKNYLLETQKRCLITSETIQCLLQAAHIKPFNSFTGDENPHMKNAILMRADLHLLFDSGYMSFANNGEILWSKTLLEHSEYAKYKQIEIPDWIDKTYVTFHRENIFKYDSE